MEEKKYLDYQGLQTYHENLLSVLDNSELATAEALDDLDDRLKVIEDKSPYSKSEIDLLLTPITDKLENIEEFAEVNVQSDWNLTDTTADDYIKNKPGIGIANGLATLDSAGKVPSSQLPSYVDDVIEGYYHGEEDPQSGEIVYNMYEDNEYTILITPESGKIYLDIPSSNSYRWSGSQYVLIGAPYILPTASANTLGGVKVGENLSIDQNGVLSAQASTGDAYTKQLSDDKYTIIKDSATAPTESTLTYTENGTVKNFKRGDEIRVADQESETGYTFYKLYALTTEGGVTTANWDKLGAGSAPVNPNETVNISLTQINGDSADLIGAAVTITNDDTSETILTATWNGSTITIEIPMGTYYTVSAETIVGYLACEPKSYLAGYQTTRNIGFQYRASGAFIEATDGTLYTASTWASSGKTANAVVLLTDTCRVRMALSVTSLPIHSSMMGMLDNYITAKDLANAKVDYDGEGNTNKIVQFNTGYGTNTTSYAAPYCKAFIFTYPSGQKGCLPSFGQLWALYQNKTEVDACLVACSGAAMGTYWIWSSTFYGVESNGVRMCYVLMWSNGQVSYDNLADSSGLVHPVSTYDI